MTANEHYNLISDVADDFPGSDEDFTPAELDRIRGTIGTISAPVAPDPDEFVPDNFLRCVDCGAVDGRTKCGAIYCHDCNASAYL